MSRRVARRSTAKARLRLIAVNGALVLFSLALCLLLLELGLGIWWTETGWPLREVDPQDRTRFIPHTDTRYHSTEFDFGIRTNRFGRRDREWSAAEMAEEGNILAIGDSFVMGYGVEMGESITGQMESQAEGNGCPREVFNFGMSGEIALPEYLRLFEQAAESGIGARRVVVALFLGNDFNLRMTPGTPEGGGNAEGTGRSRWWWGKLEHSRSYRFIRSRIVSTPAVIDVILRLGDLFGLPVYRTKSSYLFLRSYTPRQQRHVDEQLAVMARLHDSALGHGRDLTFVLIPNKIQVENARALTNTHFDADRPNRVILDYCRDHALRCLDLTPPLRERFQETGQELYFPVDRHFNRLGNQLAATLILSYLNRTSDTDTGAPGACRGDR